jgi:hypothetical protein
VSIGILGGGPANRAPDRVLDALRRLNVPQPPRPAEKNRAASMYGCVD